LIVYIHIPKCAGNAVWNFWQQNFQTKWYFGSQVDRKKPLLTWAKSAGYQVVGGHMPYGAHEFLGPVQYATMLRDPIERVLSHYYSLRNAHPEKVQLPLIRYLEQPNEKRIFPTNSMTLLLSDLTYKVDDAKRNLEKFAYYGFVEHFAESLNKMGRVFDCAVYPDPAVKVNKTTKRRHMYDLTSDEIEFIARQESKDIELYNWAYDNCPF